MKINLQNFTREAALKLTSGNDFLISAVIDKAAGFAYFGTDTGPGRVVKINLATFAFENMLILNATEPSLASAVIDIKNGFAYFGTRTKPGLIVTVKLLDFTRVNAQETSNPNEDYLTAAVINPDNGYAYFGTGFDTADTQYLQFNKPGVIIRLGTTTIFTQTGSLQFPGEDKLASGVIDESGGFAYFGTETIPGIVVKVRTSDNTRVAALTLNPGEDNLTSAVIDSKNGYAYFGKGTVETDTIPGLVVKVKLSDFTRVTSLTLNAGENGLRSAVIDATAGFAYFGTRGTPSRVIKINLSTFTRVAAVTLNPNEDDLASAVIDTKNGFAYFGTDTQPGIVVKIKLSPFGREAALTLDPGQNNLTSAVINTTGEVSYAYFGTHTSPGIVVQIKLNDFTNDSFLQLSGQGFERLISAVINPAADRAYFGTDPLSGNGNGRVIAVQLSDLSQAGSVELNTSEDPLRAAVIDTTAGFALFGIGSAPGAVVKVQLSPLTRLSGLKLNLAAFNFWSAVIDPDAGFAYFGTWSQPGIIVKVRLADFSRVGTLALAPTEDGLRSAVIDTVNGFAYFGTYTTPGKVVKVDLATFTRADVLPLTAGDDKLTSAVIDAAQGQAYFGTDTVPGRVAKIDLATFTRAAGITLNAGEDMLESAVIDLLTGNAYFGTFTTPGKIIKIGLASFARVNNLTLQAGEDFLTSAVIDPAKGFAYFGTWTTPARAIKIKLQGLTRDSANTYSAAQALFTSAVIDPKSDLAYFGTQTTPGRVVKINLSNLALVDTLVMKNSKEDFLTAAVIDPDNNAAYFGAGYSEADPQYLLFNTPGIVMKIGLNPRVDTKKSTATVISATPNPSEVGQNVRFTVTVTGEGGGIPTGSVTFYHHGTIGSGTLNGSGIAIFNTTTIPTETHIITATYDGDSNFVGSTSAPFLHTVNQAAMESSKITISSDLNPSISGEPVNFTAVITSVPGTGELPTGQVQFYLSGAKMGSPRRITNGMAFTALNRAVDGPTYTVTAKYLGDSRYTISDANVLTQVISNPNPNTPTKIYLPLAKSGQAVTTLRLQGTQTAKAGEFLTFQVDTTNGTETGNVTFYDGATPFSSAALVLGFRCLDMDACGPTSMAVLGKPFPFTVGVHTITARYPGDSVSAPTISNPLTLTVN